MAIFRIYSRQIIFGIGRQVEFDLKKKIFGHLLKLDLQFFLEQRTGNLISIITNDVQSIRSLAGFGLLNIANTLISFVVILPLMFHLHAKLTWSFLALIPLVIFFVLGLSSQIKKCQEQVQERLSEMSNFLEQNFSGIYIIKSFAQESSETKRFDIFNTRLKTDYLRLAGLRSFIGPVMKVIASLGFVLLLYFAGHARNFSPGDFAAYSLYIQRLLWPIATLGWIITIFYRAEVSFERIDSLLNRKSRILNQQQSINKKTFDNLLELKNFNINVYPKDFIGIYGKVASGKTLLAYSMLRLIEPNDNEIMIDGIDIKNLSLEALRSLIVLVPQEAFLFPMTIAENINYANNLSFDQIQELAKIVEIHDEIEAFANSYNSLLGEGGINLSGGQRQRLSIARALGVNSPILILDDSFSNLDSLTGQKILNNILDYRKDLSTIIISHSQALLRGSRIFEMQEGVLYQR